MSIPTVAEVAPPSTHHNAVSSRCPSCLTSFDRAWNFCTHCGDRLGAVRVAASAVGTPVPVVVELTQPIGLAETGSRPSEGVTGRTLVTRGLQAAAPYRVGHRPLHIERLAPIAPAGTGPRLDQQQLRDGDILELDRGASGLVSSRGRLEYEGGRLLVVDDGIEGGIWIRIAAPRRLRDGDEVRIGQQTMRFEHAEGSGADGFALASYRGRLQTLVDGAPVGSAHRLSGRSLLMGRISADIAFPQDSHVSATHARIGPGKRGVAVEDLGSTNGTFVRLRTGDAIVAGATVLAGHSVLRVR